MAVPDDVVAALRSGKRPAVRITIGGHSYRTTVFSMGGRFLVPLNADNRAAAGVAGGDEVDVDIERHTATREVTVRADLADALAQGARAQGGGAQELFDGLSYTHRKEWVRWIEEAKRAETRAARIAKTVASLDGGDLGLAERLDEVAHAHPTVGRGRQDRQHPEPDRVGQGGESPRQVGGLVGVEGGGQHRRAAHDGLGQEVYTVLADAPDETSLGCGTEGCAVEAVTAGTHS